MACTVLAWNIGSSVRTARIELDCLALCSIVHTTCWALYNHGGVSAKSVVTTEKLHWHIQLDRSMDGVLHRCHTNACTDSRGLLAFLAVVVMVIHTVSVLWRLNPMQV